MTNTNSIFGAPMAQVTKLFGAQTSRLGSASRQPETKAPAAPHASLISTARNIASEALSAIQALTSRTVTPAQTQASPGAGLFDQLRSLWGGDASADQGPAGGTSLGAYSFSFSQHITLASATTSGRGSKMQTYEISVEFSYAEGFASVGGQGEQTAAFRAMTAQISVSFASVSSRYSRSHGDNAHRQQLQCVAPGPNQQWSNSVMMASGRYESAALWTPTASASWSKATEISVGFQSSLFQARAA